MNRKRSSEMIMECILEVCVDGASKTKIVYKSNLNSTTVNPYIDTLVENCLLELVQGQHAIYKTTIKGIDFMRGLKQHNDELLKLSSFIARAY
ncbi:Winged helix-turn-helix [uncultured archaeon]|nr:Winged helix-turn-helix [uncultured archaeon]